MKIVKNDVINIIRVIIGSFFMLSALIKLNDPLGLSFKLEEYFASDVFDIPFLIPWINVLSFLLIIMELNLGFMFIVGFAINKVKVYILFLVIFFGFITFYSAYFDKVTDCGCFGDAIPLTPWQSFYKNLIILALIIIAWKKWKPKKNINKYRFIKIFSILNIFYLVIFGYVMSYLPILDFRPFSQGKLLSANIENIYEQDNIKWLYRVEGKVKEFETKDEPWNIPNAQYVDRIQREVDSRIKQDFIVFYNGEKFTDSLINMDKFIMVVIYQTNKAHNKGIEKIKDMLLNFRNIIPIVFVYGDEYIQTPSFDRDNIYYMYSDRTLLKTIIRANPGIVLVEKNKIIKKWSWRGFSEDELYKQLRK